MITKIQCTFNVSISLTGQIHDLVWVYLSEKDLSVNFDIELHHSVRNNCIYTSLNIKIPPIAGGRAMIEIKADRFPVHRCIYCKGQGEENIFVLSDRWDKNPELDPKNIVGELVSKDDEVFEILSDNSSPGLGAPICFQLMARRLTLVDKIKRLRAETEAGLRDAKMFLDSYGYNEDKEMLIEKVRRQKART